MYNIYLIKNKVNNKVYIGKTHFSLEERFKQHCRIAALGKKLCYFQKAIRKYGANNFEITLLNVCNTNIEANHSEIEYIAKYESKNSTIGYNLTDGGEGVAGRKKTKEEIELIRQSVFKRRDAISKANSGKNNGNYGKPESLESRLAKGKKISQTKKLNPIKNIKLSDETKNKLKQISLNRVSQKISDSIKDEIVADYKTGNFVKRDLSDKYNIPFSIIQNILRYWEVVKVNKLTRPTDEQRANIIKLRSDGYGYLNISEIVGLSKVTVRNIWKVYKKKAHILAFEYGKD